MWVKIATQIIIAVAMKLIDAVVAAYKDYLKNRERKRKLKDALKKKDRKEAASDIDNIING